MTVAMLLEFELTMRQALKLRLAGAKYPTKATQTYITWYASWNTRDIVIPQNMATWPKSKFRICPISFEVRTLQITPAAPQITDTVARKKEGQARKIQYQLTK